LAEQAKPLLRSAEQSNWLERIEHELDNFRAALDWSMQSCALETGLSLACELGEFWWRQGYSSEGLTWFKRLLDRYHPEDVTRARALALAGLLSIETGNYREANSLCESSLELSRELKYQDGTAGALCLLGTTAFCLGDLTKALGLLDDGLALYRQTGDEYNIALNLLFLANIQRKVGDNQGTSRSSNESLALFRKHGNKWGIAWALQSIGNLAILQGDHGHAWASFLESGELYVELGDKLGLVFSLEVQAITLAELKQYYRATRLWGFAEAWRESIHSLLPPSFHGDYAPYVQATHSALGGDAFEIAWQEGRSLTLEQAVALAMQPSPDELETPPAPDALGTPPSKLPDAAEQYALTRREVEVLRLVAAGLTDAQVAEELVISPRTVSKHLQSIYGKIQVNSRSAATRFALEYHIA
jgi:DNA-binding CsgD family transcriptional regulator